MTTEAELADAFGIATRHERMPNGELRFRLVADDGSAYIRTVAGPEGAWQNSHFHKQVRETYIVERGWMGYVHIAARAKVPKWRVLTAGEILTTPLLRPHNVYLSAGAVIHTVKHSGAANLADWHASAELDALSKPIGEAELLRLAKAAS